LRHNFFYYKAMDYWRLRIYLSQITNTNMKKIAFALLAIVGFTTANAQQDHSVLLYGNAAFNSVTNPDKSNYINWHVNPGVGYQFTKHWVAGVEVGWSQSPDAKSGGIRNNVYHAGVFGRYVQYMGGSHFYCFPQLNVSYQGQYTTDNGSAATNKASGLNATLTPNVGYMFGKGFSAYASYGSLSYETMKADGAGNATNTFNFDFNNGFTFGISKNFGCKMMHQHHHDANAEMHGSNNDKNDADEDGDKPMKKGKHHHHHKDNDKDDE
jgi:hypothetical protein